ncbi:MAG: hypothetical protein WC441_05185 [Patescibacteria group bacterium]
MSFILIMIANIVNSYFAPPPRIELGPSDLKFRCATNALWRQLKTELKFFSNKK